MSKERLEEIEERFYKTGYEINTASPEPQQIHADLQYLIYTVKEQADRVQELGASCESWQKLHDALEVENKRYRDRIEELEAKNWKYIEQNKRYRETLETLFHKALVFAGHEDLDVHNPELFQFASAVSFSSQQALEGEE